MYSLTAPSEIGRTRQSPRTRGFAPFSALALLLMLFSALPSFAQTVLTTLGAANGLNGPTFLALDTRTIDGVNATWLYVAEHGNTDNTGGGRILRYNLTSGATTATVVAGNGTGANQFTSPDQIIVDGATGDLFIADRAQNVVKRITNAGAAVSTFGSGVLRGPTGMARDGSGNFYVAEHGDTLPASTPGAGGGFVSKWDAAGTQVWRVGGQGAGDGQFAVTGPYGAAISGSSLLVSDSFSSRIQLFNMDTGAYQSQFAVPGTLPLGLFIDSTGALWVSESSGNGTGAIQRVERMSASGGSATMTLESGFSLPFHTVVDTAANRAYVADWNNDRVVVFDLTVSSGGSVPAINSSATASGTVGQNFSYQITATNSPTSYAIVSGDSLPTGLTLNTTTGVITGIPSASGTSTTRVTASNATGASAAFTITFTLAPATTTGTPALPLGPSITGFEVSAFTRNVGGDVRVTFSAPVTGVDVSDFVINSQGTANGAITGVDPDPSNPNAYLIHFTYQDQTGYLQFAINTTGTGITAGTDAFRGAGLTASPIYGTGDNGAILLQPVGATVTAGTPSGNDASFTVTYAQAVTGVDASDFIITGTSATIGTVTGSGTTYTVPVTASGAGTVTLTPIGGGSAAVIDAANNWFGGAAAASVAIGGGSTGPVPAITSAATASGTVGSAFNYQITASNSPTSYTATGLPAGLSVNTATGVISGTPTAAGTSSATLTASNANGSSANFTLTITVAGTTTGPVPAITSAATASGTVGSAFNYQITASNTPTSYAASGLPAGLSVNTATGVISGTPTAAGTSSATLTASNANGTSANFTLTITVAGTTTGPVPAVTSAATASGTVGSAFSYQITASNAPTSYAASGLPAGLSVNTATGVISGTPTAAGTSSATLTASNANGTSANFTLTITVAPMPVLAPVVNTATVTGQVGVAITPVQVTASNSPTSFSAPGLAAYGLSISGTGLISGTPTASASGAVVAVTASNAGGSGSANITLNLAAAAGAPVVSNASMSLTAGIPMAYTVQATNSPTSFSMTGAPAGLSISNTGVITGTPSGEGNHVITVTATNASGSGSGSITLELVNVGGGDTGNGKKSQTVSFQGPISLVFVGSPLKLQALVDSGLPVTYTVVSGNATIMGDTLVVHNKGTVVVRATQAGNEEWESASAMTTITADKRLAEPKVNLPEKLHTDKGAALPTTTEEGLPITYTVISGPATVQDGKVVFTGSGKVKLRATVEGNSVYDGVSQLIDVEGTPVPRLTNISTRLKVTANDAQGATIAGFVVTGDQPKQILVRAVGPTLAAHGVGSPLADPTLKLYNSANTIIATNSGWNNDADIAAATAQAFGFPLQANSKDAAILMTLQPGTYTAQVQSMTNSGTVLIEVYDVTAGAAVPTKQLVNISTRGFVGTEGDAVITGFVVSGAEPKKLLIRAAGPALTAYGVTGVLTDPVIRLYKASTLVASNDNWGTPQQVGSETPATAAEITLVSSASGAFPFAAGSADAVVVATLEAGSYTAIVTGADGTTGTALVEVYEIPNP